MLIRIMTFVFHKSKQALTKATLKKLSMTINITEASFCSNEQFCGIVVTRQIWYRLNESCLTIQVTRKFPSWIKCDRVVLKSIELQPRHWGFIFQFYVTGIFDSGWTIHAQPFRPNKISWPKSIVYRYLK